MAINVAIVKHVDIVSAISHSHNTNFLSLLAIKQIVVIHPPTHVFLSPSRTASALRPLIGRASHSRERDALAHFDTQRKPIRLKYFAFSGFFLPPLFSRPHVGDTLVDHAAAARPAVAKSRVRDATEIVLARRAPYHSPLGVFSPELDGTIHFCNYHKNIRAYEAHGSNGY